MPPRLRVPVHHHAIDELVQLVRSAPGDGLVRQRGRQVGHHGPVELRQVLGQLDIGHEQVGSPALHLLQIPVDAVQPLNEQRRVLADLDGAQQVALAGLQLSLPDIMDPEPVFGGLLAVRQSGSEPLPEPVIGCGLYQLGAQPRQDEGQGDALLACPLKSGPP